MPITGHEGLYRQGDAQRWHACSCCTQACCLRSASTPLRRSFSMCTSFWEAASFSRSLSPAISALAAASLAASHCRRSRSASRCAAARPSRCAASATCKGHAICCNQRLQRLQLKHTCYMGFYLTMQNIYLSLLQCFLTIAAGVCGYCTSSAALDGAGEAAVQSWPAGLPIPFTARGGLVSFAGDLHVAPHVRLSLCSIPMFSLVMQGELQTPPLATAACIVSCGC